MEPVWIVLILLPYPILCYLLYASIRLNQRLHLRDRATQSRLVKWKAAEVEARKRYEDRLLKTVSRREKRIVASVDEVATGLGDLFLRLKNN